MSNPWDEFPDAPTPMSDSATALTAEFLTATRYETWWPSQVYDAYFAGALTDRAYLDALRWQQAKADGYHTRTTVYDREGFVVGTIRTPVRKHDIEWAAGQ